MFLGLGLSPDYLSKLTQKTISKKMRSLEASLKKAEKRSKEQVKELIKEIKGKLIASAKKGGHQIHSVHIIIPYIYLDDYDQECLNSAKSKLIDSDRGKIPLGNDFRISKDLRRVRDYFVSRNFNVSFVLSKETLSGPSPTDDSCNEYYNKWDAELVISW